MHDDTIAGQAVADRAMAFWTDPDNFDDYQSENDREFERIIAQL